MTEEQPPVWAMQRAIEEAALIRKEPWLMPSPDAKQAVEAFARYIMQHEQPPVDPDVSIVREILAQATPYEDVAKSFLAGDWDSKPQFIAALTRFRQAVAARSPAPPISNEQMISWTRKLLIARHEALNDMRSAASVRNGTRDNESAFYAVKAALSEILSGANFG